MKSIVSLIAVLLVSLASPVFGQVPSTGGSSSSASADNGGAESTTERRGPALMSASYEGAIVEVIPVLAPPQNMTSSWSVLKLLEEDYLAGTLTTNNGYALPYGKIGWQNLIYAEGMETGWPVLQQLIVVTSGNGGDNISLSEVKVSATSTGNALNADYGFANLGYSEAAFGIKADGTYVTSGPATQKVAKIAVVTQLRLFNGGATPEGLNVTKNYVLAQANFTVLYRAEVVGNPNSFGTAMVSIAGFAGNRPRLVITRENISLTGGDIGRGYNLQAADQVTGPWATIAVLRTGEVWPVARDRVARFYRAVAQ